MHCEIIDRGFCCNKLKKENLKSLFLGYKTGILVSETAWNVIACFF